MPMTDSNTFEQFQIIPQTSRNAEIQQDVISSNQPEASPTELITGRKPEITLETADDDSVSPVLIEITPKVIFKFESQSEPYQNHYLGDNYDTIIKEEGKHENSPPTFTGEPPYKASDVNHSLLSNKLGTFELGTDENDYITEASCDCPLSAAGGTTDSHETMGNNLKDSVIPRNQDIHGLGNIISPNFTKRSHTSVGMAEAVPNSEICDLPEGLSGSFTTFCCPFCGSRFIRKDNLRSHMREHLTEPMLPCSQCDRRFRDRSALLSHERIHTTKPYLKCPCCTKKFTYKGFLTNHMKKHTDKESNRLKSQGGVNSKPKPSTSFPCSECNRIFLTKLSLAKHRRIHASSEPYNCCVCEKRFRLKSELTKHSCILTGEERYSCEQCRRKFQSVRSLANHSRYHNIIRPRNCTISWLADKKSPTTIKCPVRKDKERTLKKIPDIMVKEIIDVSEDVSPLRPTSNSTLSETVQGSVDKSSHFIPKDDCAQSLCESSQDDPCNISQNYLNDLKKCKDVESDRNVDDNLKSFANHVTTNTTPDPSHPAKYTNTTPDLSHSAKGSNTTPDLSHSAKGTNTMADLSHATKDTNTTPNLSLGAKDTNTAPDLSRGAKDTNTTRDISRGVKNTNTTSDLSHGAKDTNTTPYRSRAAKENISSIIQQLSEIDKTFSCPQCPKKFYLKLNLNLHLQTHAKRKVFACNYCGRRFCDKCDLKVHVQTHRIYGCPRCKEKFANKISLQSHLCKTISKEGFACMNCKRVFGTKVGLQRHLRTSCCGKRFSCHDCTKRFAKESELDSHKRVHLIEPFTCGSCRMTVVNEKTLKQHGRLCSVKPYVCPYCYLGVDQKSYLLRHMQNMHQQNTM